MQRAYAKKWKRRPVLIYNKNILLCFLYFFSSFNTTQYDDPQFTPSWRINCRIELVWWILSKCPFSAKSNCVIDSLLSLAYLYFCLLFEHLVPLVLSLPCLWSHHLTNQKFFHSVKLRCALLRACPLQLHSAGENHIVEDERFWVSTILAAMNLEHSSSLVDAGSFFAQLVTSAHTSSFCHGSWIFRP